MIGNLTLIFINFLINAIWGNDCGIYSVRGFAAGLITICTLGSGFLILLLELFVALYDRFNSYLKSRFDFAFTSEKEQDGNENDNRLENTYDKANKIC